MVCSGEFWFLTGKGIPPRSDEAEAFRNNEYARLIIEFPKFNKPLFWSLRNTELMPKLNQKDQESLLS